MTQEANEKERRLDVWQALSDLFLDTELTDRDYDFIAKKVLESGYTPTEIKTILWFEVFPALESNLLDPTGVWAGYPRDWLEKNMSIFTHALQPIQDTDTVADIKNGWQKVCGYLPNEYA